MEATNLEKILHVEIELLERMTTLNEKKLPSKTSDKVKLAKIEIPLFNGERTKFQTFWDSFETCIHNSDISNIYLLLKFTYLMSKLTRKASEAISGLSLTSTNYVKIMNYTLY